MPPTLRSVVVGSTVLLAHAAAYGQTLPANSSSLARSADVALAAGRSLDAVRACAEALRRFPDDSAAHARRNLAIARLRCLAAFDLSPRVPFAKRGRPVTEDVYEKVRNAFSLIGASGLLGPLPPRAALARAYGLLLLSQWFDAESAALEALKADAGDQFAIYVAAEAALQRGDFVAALKYFRDAQQIAIMDPDLRDFIDEFGVLHEAHAIAVTSESAI